MDSYISPILNNKPCLDLLQESLCADLDFHGTNGKHSSHGWHPFPAKFPPQLPQFFIENLSGNNEVVFDPMFGSGTTLVEAVRLGRRAIGCDIDPLARLIAEAKLVVVNPVKTLEAGYSIVASAQSEFHRHKAQLEQELNQRFGLDTKTRAFIDYWFLPQQQLELLALLKSIEALRKDEMQTFFKMIFSATIIAKSGGVSLARDLAHTRPHKVSDKKPKSAFTEFIRRLKYNLSAYTKDTMFDQGATTIQNVDLRVAHADKTGIPSSSVDLIVTSPPYANNAIDYMRAHKFSLVWFGWKIEDLTRIRARYLGHDASNGVQFGDLPQQCEKTLVRLDELDSRKAAALRRYFGEMSAVINEMKRVLKKGRAAVIVVGTSTLSGIDVETQKGLAAIGQNTGFNLAGIGVRRLDRDKRMMPARWGKEQHSQIEKRMHEEYIIGLIKP